MPALPPGIEGSTSLSLNESQVNYLRRLRAAVPSNIPLYVTSATRTPETQASALATKRNLGDDLYKLYAKGNHDIIQALMAVPNTVADMANVLRKYVSQGRYLSRHMRGDALDLRSKTLTSTQIQTVMAAAKQLGAKTKYETLPPHIHIESIGHTVSDAVQYAQDTAQQAQSSAREAAAQAQMYAAQASVTAQDAARRQKKRAARAAEALYARRQTVYTIGAAAISVLLVTLFAYRQYRKQVIK